MLQWRQLSDSDLENISLKYITLRLKNGEIRINYYFFANLKEGIEVTQTCNEGFLEWFLLDDVNSKNMPYSAQYVLKHYLDTGRYSTQLYAGIATESGVDFIVLKEF